MTGPEVNKPLMAFDGNFSTVQIGSLLSPIKVHILCPQIPVNGMSVLRERVCIRVSKEA